MPLGSAVSLGSAGAALVKAVSLVGALVSHLHGAMPIRAFGVFHTDEAHPEVIRLHGEIGPEARDEFRRALEAAPGARLLVLDSIGGRVQAAMLVAAEVHRRGIATAVPAAAGCYSACALIYFAGVERAAMGELGVHQATSPHGAGLSNLMMAGVMRGYGVPRQVVTMMEETPPERMHVFSRRELRRYKLEYRGPVLSGMARFWMLP